MRFIYRCFFLTSHLVWQLALALSLGLVLSSAQAARPMITDDAEIVDAKACQLESWIQSNRGSTEYWALPACNPTGNVKLTLGGARLHSSSGPHFRVAVFQGKTVLKALEANGWGLALSVGTAKQRPAGSSAREWYVNAPASFSFRNDSLLLHTNLGWLRDPDTQAHRLTWGLGSTTQLTERSWLIAESFGQNRGKPLYQVGVRHWVVPDRVQIDMTYGDRFGAHSQERWFSIGLRILSAPFLP